MVFGLFYFRKYFTTVITIIYLERGNAYEIFNIINAIKKLDRRYYFA